MAAYCLPASGVTLWPDTVRDLSASLALARGESFPVLGPPINFGPHLGPAWIWLQAVVLLFWPTLTATSLYVAAVASLKFPLLYALGRTIGRPHLGLCFAIVAALPAIGVYQWLVFFHPNWVEAAIGTSLLLGALAWKRRSIGYVHAAALAAGLAIQLHPTAAFYIPAIPLLLLALRIRGRRLVLHLTIATLAILVWFLPLAFDSEAKGANQWAEGASRVGEGIRAFEILDVFSVLRTAHVEVPMGVGETYGVAAGLPAGAWLFGLMLMGGAIVVGFISMIVKNGSGRRWLLALTALLFAGWFVTTAIRTYTSFYLAYFLLPLSAIVFGLALDQLDRQSSWLARVLGRVALGTVVLGFVVASIGARYTALGGLIDSPLFATADLRNPHRASIRATLVTVAARDSFTAFACHQGTVTLHGDLAMALAASTQLDFRMHCPQMPVDVRVMGPGPDDPKAHWASLPKRVSEELGMRPRFVHGGLATFSVRQVVHPPEGRRIETDWYHFERLRDRRELQKISREFDVRADEWLAIHRLKPFDSRWRLLAAECDGVAMSPSFTTHNSVVYSPCSGRGGNGHWVLAFETDAPQWVDVYTFHGSVPQE